jgi:hypothetical protein
MYNPFDNQKQRNDARIEKSLLEKNKKKVSEKSNP